MRFVDTSGASENLENGSAASGGTSRHASNLMLGDGMGASAAALALPGIANPLGSGVFGDWLDRVQPHRRADRHRVDNSRRAQYAIKRGIDIVGAGLLLILLSPLLIAIALTIRFTSRGPALFRQTRTGLDNQPFEILKFRSMYTDRCDISGVDQTVSGDPRITPIGRVLRKTNIDELPQLINVLKGDMSLIGPRPHVPGMLAGGVPYEEFVDFYGERHHMRPGITGLAQSQGLRGPTVDPHKALMRVVRDIEYVRDFSLWMDVVIVWNTVKNEFVSGNGF